MSNSLGPHGLQHTRLPYPSLSPSVCSNSCPLSQWCYLTISSSATLFFSSPQSCPASGSFPMSRLFTSGGQSIGASVSVLPMNIQGWFPSGLTWFNLLAVQRLSSVFSSTTVWRHQFFSAPPFFNCPTLTSIHDYWEKHGFDYTTFINKVMLLLFNTLSRLVIAFLQRSRCLLISWLKSPSVVILELKKLKSVTVSIISPSICHEVMGPNALI